MQKIVFLLCIIQSLYCHSVKTVKEFMDIEVPQALQVLKQKAFHMNNNFDHKVKTAVQDIDKFEEQTKKKHPHEYYFAHMFTLILNNDGNNPQKIVKIKEDLIYPTTIMGTLLNILKENPAVVYNEIKNPPYRNDNLNHALGHILIKIHYGSLLENSMDQAS